MLNLTVYEFMHSPVITTEAGVPAAEALAVMARDKVSCLPVLDNGRLAGLVTERTVFRKALSHGKFGDLRPFSAADLMREAPDTVRTTDRVRTVLDLFLATGLRQVVATEDGKSVDGIVTFTDIVNCLASSAGLDDTAVREVMTTGLITVAPDAPLDEAARTMLDRDISGLVVAGRTKAEGIITERNVARHLMRDLSFGAATVGDHMSAPVIAVDADTLLLKAVIIMRAKKFRRLLVREGDTPVGMLTQSNIVAAVCRNLGTCTDTGD